jgi:hypothetical protein
MKYFKVIAHWDPDTKSILELDADGEYYYKYCWCRVFKTWVPRKQPLVEKGTAPVESIEFIFPLTEEELFIELL